MGSAAPRDGNPLPPESADELLEALLGGDPSVEPLKHLLIGRTEGNPFFLEESIRTLVETRVLAGERGAYRMAKALPTIQVPGTVQAVLAARIDRLPPEEKALLQSASVIGKDVPFALLQAVAELPEEALRRDLAHLQAAEFLYETTLFPEVEYTFRHALTHEVAYGSLLQERRRALHARIVEAFERLYPDRVTEKVNWLAHHAFRGEVWGKALSYLRQTVASASPASLDAVLGGPESPGHCWWIGDHERAIKAGQRELAIAADFGNFPMRVVTRFRLGQVYHSLGDYPRAMEFLRQNVESLDGELLRERFGMAGLPSVFSRAWLAWCFAERGDFADGIACAEEAVRIADSVDHAYSRIVAYFGMGNLYLTKGDPHGAIPGLERGLVLDQVERIALLFPFVASPLGCAYALAGRVGEALALLEDAVERAASMKLIANHSLRIACLGEVHLLAGRPGSATQLAERALDLSHEHRERGHQAYALRLLGDIASAGDPPDVGKAEASYRQGLALAGELGMRPLLARCQLALGALHRRIGRLEHARAELSAAIELLRSMEMPFWLTRAEAELAEVN